MVDVSTTRRSDVTTSDDLADPPRRALVCALEANSALLQPELIRERIDALDALDLAFGALRCEVELPPAEIALAGRVAALRASMEAANEELYASLRREIVQGCLPPQLPRCLHACSAQQPNGEPLPGLGFDAADELLSGVLQLREPEESHVHGLSLTPEMVYYQPTPARHALELIDRARIAAGDIFIDLGSGLGHVPLLVASITGAESIGVEVQRSFAARAEECARSLRLDRVSFRVEDARATDLSQGSVFYLYSPFRGSMLNDVLNALEQQRRKRSILVCSLGPGTLRIAQEPWLSPRTPPDPMRVTVFASR